MRAFSLSPVLLLVLLLGLGSHADYRFGDASRIWIDGTSTIHDWTCEASDIAGAVTLDAATGVPSAAHVVVPVGTIDCDNGTMNRKLRDALGANAHPTVRWTLEQSAPATRGIGLTGTLAIAGTTRPAAFDATMTPVGDGRYRFAGHYTFSMRDFGVTPPTAMLGTLKTGAEVTVRFDVVTEPR